MCDAVLLYESSAVCWYGGFVALLHVDISKVGGYSLRVMSNILTALGVFTVQKSPIVVRFL